MGWVNWIGSNRHPQWPYLVEGYGYPQTGPAGACANLGKANHTEQDMLLTNGVLGSKSRGSDGAVR